MSGQGNIKAAFLSVFKQTNFQGSTFLLQLVVIYQRYQNISQKTAGCQHKPVAGKTYDLPCTIQFVDGINPIWTLGKQKKNKMNL